MVNTTGVFLGGVANQRNTSRQLGIQERGVAAQEGAIEAKKMADIRAQASKNIEMLTSNAQQFISNYNGSKEELLAEGSDALMALANQARTLARQAGLPEPNFELLLKSTPTALEAINLEARKAGTVAQATGLANLATQEAGIGIRAREAGAVAAASTSASEQAKTREELRRRDLGLKDPETEKDQFDNAQKLRTEFTRSTEEFVKVRDAYQRVLSATENPSAAGDLALIFNYMKMLDPGSVVRESEFATAQNAAGVPDRIRAQYNQVLSGERLAPATRQDFVTQSEGLFDGQSKFYQSDVERFSTLANRFGVDPDLVVRDLVSGLAVPDEEPVTTPGAITIDENGNIVR